MNEINYEVPSMHCMHCVHTVKSELSDLAGVRDVDVSLETKMVKIGYEAPATPESIENLLAEINYPVKK